ncbi:unnamed protein product [Pleuronectes platessa]|uniref:Uncharacterized protein n=1 Tax=Pleuronectes platessa TaxID=8262 RepID=A0A9N7TN38_PLEPL|nr:unnamed protein product [Pleuronectes platessa]
MEDLHLNGLTQSQNPACGGVTKLQRVFVEQDIAASPSLFKHLADHVSIGATSVSSREGRKSPPLSHAALKMFDLLLSTPGTRRPELGCFWNLPSFLSPRLHFLGHKLCSHRPPFHLQQGHFYKPTGTGSVPQLETGLPLPMHCPKVSDWLLAHLVFKCPGSKHKGWRRESAVEARESDPHSVGSGFTPGSEEAAACARRGASPLLTSASASRPQPLLPDLILCFPTSASASRPQPLLPDLSLSFCQLCAPSLPHCHSRCRLPTSASASRPQPLLPDLCFLTSASASRPHPLLPDLSLCFPTSASASRPQPLLPDLSICFPTQPLLPDLCFPISASAS